jgi:aspartate/methionine/tyrosine aminotransferase
MSRLISFALEDFFDEYEHRSDLINLASSDSQPWERREFDARLGDWTTALPGTLAYPDLRAGLIPALEKAFRTPAGFSALPTAGAQESIAIVMHWLAAAKKVESIGLPVPAYGTFLGLANMLNLGIRSYAYTASLNWRPDISELRHLAKECDALVVINPHNPTGHKIATDELLHLAQILLTRGKTIVVDEVFVVAEESESLAYAAENVIVIGSLSKMYGLPGLRLGWILAATQDFQEFRTVQQYLTLSPSVFTVTIGTLVLERLFDEFTRVNLVKQNRTFLQAWAATHADIVSISPPMAGTTVILEIRNDRREQELFDAFLATGVLLVPGRSFGLPDRPPRFRLGYGMKAEVLDQGLRRIITAIK